MSDLQIHPTATDRSRGRARGRHSRRPLLYCRGRGVVRRKLLAATSRHAGRAAHRRAREQILRLLLDRATNPGPEISRRADLSGDRRRELLPRVCHDQPQHIGERKNARRKRRKFSRLLAHRPRLHGRRRGHFFQQRHPRGTRAGGRSRRHWRADGGAPILPDRTLSRSRAAAPKSCRTFRPL